MQEIRAADLAFTPAEASELLAPLELPATDVEALWERSEGWAAGLRIAELSLHDWAGMSPVKSIELTCRAGDAACANANVKPTHAETVQPGARSAWTR